MSDPGYDFFATGHPQVPPGSPALPPPPVAAPSLPPPPAPPVDVVYNAPPPAAQFTRADGVTVNQFGTPIGTASAPTGPYAAPGVGSVPTQSPGMVSTWGAPAASSGHRVASRSPRSDAPPRNVLAVAWLAVFFGVLATLSTLFALVSLLQLSSLGVSSDIAGTWMAALVVSLIVLGAVAALLLIGAAGTIAGRRWGGWMLVASYSLYLLGQVQSFASGGFRLFDLLFVLIALVLLLVLVTGEGLAWLRGPRP
ncbi:MAG TPA: hypothetical protein VFL59_02240 [Candidatus Nanopelagicales bacterium]|nr:hypothetical protein [Candidatus Nanopelagicales bacterium]